MRFYKQATGARMHFKMVFVAPNRTKLEHKKHQRLMAELKERKSKGENLMIRNGQIIARHILPGRIVE